MLVVVVKMVALVWEIAVVVVHCVYAHARY